jgi:hypothetical protein
MDVKPLETTETPGWMESQELPPLNTSDPRFQDVDQVEKLLSGGIRISESHENVKEVEGDVIIKYGTWRWPCNLSRRKQPYQFHGYTHICLTEKLQKKGISQCKNCQV